MGLVQLHAIQNTYDTNSEASDAHFDKSYLLSDALDETFGNPKHCEDYKEPKNKPECHEIESNPLKYRAMQEEDNPLF
jgi:hypothetical protein